MSNIPLARERLHEIAQKIGNLKTSEFEPTVAEQIYGVIALMHRAPKNRKAAATKRPMTRDLRDQIKKIALHEGTLPLDEIAYRVNVNPGRVSEVLHGHYDHL